MRLLFPQNSVVRACALLTFFAVVSGCGGGGGLGGSANAVSLNTSKSTLVYGEQVSISWGTSGTDQSIQNGFVSCNFADVSTPLAANGSIQDRPAITTTYRMTVTKSGGGTASDAVTVQVAKGSGRFLIVGNNASADSVTAQTLLTEVTSVTPTLAATIPATSTGFEALVLTTGGTFGPADQAKVQAWLTSGKGVVVVGNAANKLATGSVSNDNTSSIAGWFGGVSVCGNPNNYEARFVQSDANIGVAATNLKRKGQWTGGAEINTLGAATVPQSSGNIFNAPVYPSWSFVSGAGRVYFIAGLTGPAVTPDDKNASIREFFLSGARWAVGS